MSKSSTYSRTEDFLIRLVGTRGVVLLLFGIMWVILGISFVTHPMERFSKPGSGGVLDFLDKGPGVYIFSTMWLVGGVVALAAVIQRPRTCEDGWGFIGALLPPLLWGAGYWWSWIIYTLSGGQSGREGTYIAGLVYGTITFLLMFLSKNLPDHPHGPCAGRSRGNSIQ